MIVQGILDFISLWLAGLVGLVPPLPAEWASAFASVNAGAAWLGSNAALLGPIAPWATFGVIVSIWIGAIAFWAVMLGVRFLLWIVGR